MLCGNNGINTGKNGTSRTREGKNWESRTNEVDPADVGKSKNKPGSWRARVCGWRYVSVERERADIVMGSLTHVKWDLMVVLSPCHTWTEVQTVRSSRPLQVMNRNLGFNIENQAFHLNNQVNLAFTAFAANRSIVLLIHCHNYNV